MPAHLWIVGVMSLLWSGIAAYDYVQTQSRNMDYLTSVGMGPEEMAWIAGMPIWAQAAWAFAVWGGVLGAVFLLLRKYYAVHAFAVSLIGVVVLTAWQYGMPHPALVDETPTVVFTVLQWAIVIALLLYARRMRAGGVLR